MNHKIVLWILILIILVLIFIVWFGYYLYKHEYSPIASQLNQNQTSLQVNSNNGLYDVSINNLSLNTINTKGEIRLVNFSFTLKSRINNIEEIIEQNKDRIIDLVIFQFNQRTSEELLTLGGKLLLKEELLYYINQRLKKKLNMENNMPVEALLFTHFVMK